MLYERRADCERACLEGFVDQYLAALVASDPGKLPLAKNAGYTENGQELKLGDGMWGPTVTLGSYQLYFADPQAGQVGFFGTIEEHGHPVILELRLRIDNRRSAKWKWPRCAKPAACFGSPKICWTSRSFIKRSRLPNAARAPS